jgi:hypothetical protein
MATTRSVAGDDKFFEDAIKGVPEFSCGYNDSNVLKTFILFESGLADNVEKAHAHVLAKRASVNADARVKERFDPNTGAEHAAYTAWATHADQQAVVATWRHIIIPGSHTSVAADDYHRLCRDPNDGHVNADGVLVLPDLTGLQHRASEHLWHLLRRKITNADVLADINRCKDMNRRGVAAWCRLKRRVDPRDVSTNIRKILLLLLVKQDGAPVEDHISTFDHFFTSSTRAYLMPDGTINHKAFAEALLAGVFLASFSDTIQEQLRSVLSSLTTADFNYDRIRQAALTNEGFTNLTDSGQRQVAMQAAMRASQGVPMPRYPGKPPARAPFFGPRLYDGRQGGASTYASFNRDRQPLVPGPRSVPCNNCGAGSPLSGKPWHLTLDCPSKCTICTGPPHQTGCPRADYGSNSKTAAMHNSRSTDVSTYNRHPQRVALQRARANIVQELESVDAQLGMPNQDSESVERLHQYRSKMSVDLQGVKAGVGHALVI